jgi:hypothetical protein
MLRALVRKQRCDSDGGGPGYGERRRERSAMFWILSSLRENGEVSVWGDIPVADLCRALPCARAALTCTSRCIELS